MFNTKNKTDMQQTKHQWQRHHAYQRRHHAERRYQQQQRPSDRWHHHRQYSQFCQDRYWRPVVLWKVILSGNQADIVGKVSGNIHAKELLQLRGESVVTGNLYAGKLQVEPSATFNGQCHMGANIVEMNNNEQQTAAK